ncbi:hypothetical protein AGMMS50218_17890 [Actinomycetota bacterium]|nr:hypothetical protein AGMMS50218_17890 [Actinomycetota bacterium]
MRNLLFLFLIALAVYCLFDVAGSDDDERLGVPKIGWILLVVVIPVLGPVAWLAVSRAQRAARAGGPATGTRPSAPRRPSGPVAPDDDPEFLWRLDEARRKAERDKADGTGPASSSDEDPHRPTT